VELMRRLGSIRCSSDLELARLLTMTILAMYSGGYAVATRGLRVWMVSMIV
jgi:hypothetical protein